MATVATNDKLHDRLEVIPRAFLSQEKARLETQFLRHLPETGDPIYRALVGDEYIEWVAKAPTGMLDMVDKLVITSLGSNSIALDLPLNKEVAKPAGGATQFLGGTINASYKGISVNLNDQFPAWQPYVAAAEALSTKRAKIQEDIRLLNRFTLRLIRQAKSLGPILRMWPPLWDLLDTDDRRRQGAKPYGAALEIPAHVGTPEEIAQHTATVVKIKMAMR
jgi:hypothetical protein